MTRKPALATSHFDISTGGGLGIARLEAELRQTEKGVEFSVMGNYADGGGQCSGTLRTVLLGPPQKGASPVHLYVPAPQLERMLDLWDRWHLNGMRAGCEHQRTSPEFTASERLTLQELTYGPEFMKAERRAASGAMGAEEYAAWPALRAEVQRLTVAMTRPKHPALWGEAGERLLASGYVALGKSTGGHYPGHVRAEEHPQGYLSKPCPTCGYRWGNSWLHEEIPAETLQEIRTLFRLRDRQL
jgi:hypothetical protein